MKLLNSELVLSRCNAFPLKRPFLQLGEGHRRKCWWTYCTCTSRMLESKKSLRNAMVSVHDLSHCGCGVKLLVLTMLLQAVKNGILMHLLQLKYMQVT